MEDAEHVLMMVKKLREVFDACDQDGNGYLCVQRFVDLGLRFGQGDEVKKLANYLDPNAQGRISFKDFCQGVLAINGCEEIFSTAPDSGDITPGPYRTVNGYYYEVGSLMKGLRFTLALWKLNLT
ncbi:rab11 family-interacting protein 4A-like [Scleropages formosus]|uniref:rab11 family-interacting protein 4A-like n=1 Tax=Scleropages formosus TaxID=113540 RepID=UPI00087899FF|nr:rab11 family-interacting protein 4A-like [Scleropages formosus]